MTGNCVSGRGNAIFQDPLMTSMVDVDLTVYGHTKRRTALKEFIHYQWYLLKGANTIQRFQTRYNTC